MKKLKFLLPLSLMLFGCYFLGRVPPHKAPDRATLPDPHLFETVDCTTGCWLQLRPGQTTREEVERFLDTLNSRAIQGREGDFTAYDFGYPDGFSVNVLVENELLLKIRLSGWVNLSMGDIVARLGTPEKIRIFYEISANDGPRDIELNLYYPQDGYVFYFIIQPGSLDITKTSDKTVNICFHENALTSVINIVEPGSLEDMVRSLTPPIDYYELTEVYMKSLSDYQIAWPGFGCAEYPYPQP